MHILKINATRFFFDAPADQGAALAATVPTPEPKITDKKYNDLTSDDERQEWVKVALQFVPPSPEQIIAMTVKERKANSDSLRNYQQALSILDANSSNEKNEKADKARKDLLDAILGLPNQKVTLFRGGTDGEDKESRDFSIREALEGVPDRVLVNAREGVTYQPREGDAPAPEGKVWRDYTWKMTSSQVSALKLKVDHMIKQLKGEMVRGPRKPDAKKPGRKAKTDAPMA